MDKKYTPMMQQYFEIKNDYKNCLLFFRLGDFYELFFEDAIVASKELSITLTGRECGMEERAPMCGVPYHSAEGYISKLVDKGYKVAICEQVEDPKTAKTIVKREVIRVVSKGTTLDSSLLEEGKNNYIMCVFENDSGAGISVCDVTTGEFFTSSVEEKNNIKLVDEIAKYSPSEIIVNESFSNKLNIEEIFDIKLNTYDSWIFNSDNAYKALCDHFNLINLESFGIEKNKLCIVSSGALMHYLNETQKNSLSHISKIVYRFANNYMYLDISSRKNLELTENIRERNKRSSLLWILDKTKTAMGSRLIRKWIEQPLINTKFIQERLDSVEELKSKLIFRDEIKEILSTVYDIERIVSKIIYQSANSRDLILLKNSIIQLPSLALLLSSCKSSLLLKYANNLDTLKDIYSKINNSIIEDPPFGLREGGFIKDGYHENLDRYRQAKNNGTTWLLELEQKEKKSTGIKNLKIKYNKIFGYYIEVTNSYKNLVPDRYIRRQTLANCERYTIVELKEIEEEILSADEKIVELEYNLFQEIRNYIANEVKRILTTSEVIAVIDTLISIAEVSEKNNYTKPILNKEGIIDIKNGRHPVVEELSKKSFISNDTFLDLDENRLSIITGPNMSGKSTYMRQTALIVLMAQIGSFVPAEHANIGIVDRIFTRVGASDDLATGQSTFMVEMTEVANILNNATKNSLIILDEIGRGTSTYDGLSIAWSTLEYISDENILGAKTLFATHYHELTELENQISGVKNYSIAVEKKDDSLIFLHKISRGGSKYSYGIQVAKLAGLPKKVLDRADEILFALNNADIAKKQALNMEDTEPVHYGKRKPDDNSKEIIIKELLNIDLENLTSIEVISILRNLQTKTKNIN